MSDTTNDGFNKHVNMIKNIIDKKFTTSNVQVGDMLKNKAFQAITDFMNSLIYYRGLQILTPEIYDSEIYDSDLILGSSAGRLPVDCR